MNGCFCIVRMDDGRFCLIFQRFCSCALCALRMSHAPSETIPLHYQDHATCRVWSDFPVYKALDTCASSHTMFVTIITCPRGAGWQAPRHSPPLTMCLLVLPAVGQRTPIECRSMYYPCLCSCTCMCTPGSWSVWQWQVLKPVCVSACLAVPHLPCPPAHCLPRMRASCLWRATDHGTVQCHPEKAGMELGEVWWSTHSSTVCMSWQAFSSKILLYSGTGCASSDGLKFA